jgi:putative MATE family efflux protein
MKTKRSFSAIYWPILIELLFFVLMSTVDTLMLSNYSDHAVGSVGNANTLIMMFAVTLLIITNGVAVLVSQYIGAKRDDLAQKVIGNGILLNLFVGLLAAGIMLISTDQLLQLVNTKPVLYNDSKVYFQVIAFSLIFVAMSNIVTASLRSYGYAKQITIVVIIGNIFNIIGNYLLIYGRLGFPELGVYGAALSTLFVRSLMLLVYLTMAFILVKVRLKHIRIERELSKQILKIGLPSAGESLTYTIMQSIILGMVNQLGPDMTTSRSYINTILTYIYVFSLAYASANGIMTGYYIGERDYNKAHQQTMKTAIRSMFIVIFATLLVNIFSGQIVGIFTSNPIIVSTVRRILWLAILLEFARSFNMIFISALRSAGDTAFPLKLAIVSMIGITIGLAYLFGIVLGLGLFGIYMAYVSDELFRGVFMYTRWQSRKWEAKSSYLENTI